MSRYNITTMDSTVFYVTEGEYVVENGGMKYNPDNCLVRMFLRGGWPGKWYCITENGDTMETSSELLTLNEIVQKYGSDLIDVILGRTTQVSTKNIIHNDKRTVN
jgi:hypothetical protein